MKHEAAMNNGRHEAVLWTGTQVIGTVPMWLKLAVNRGPLSRRGVSRVHKTVHIFDGDGKLRQIADAGDWIVYSQRSGNIFAQTKAEMFYRWESRDGALHRRAYDASDIGEKLTSVSHPLLHKCFETISHDSGGRAGHQWYDVPRAWCAYLDVARLPSVEHLRLGLRKDVATPL